MTIRQRVLIVEQGSQRGVLAATRALGRAGHEVTIASGERAHAGRSRWAARRVEVAVDDGDRLVADVERCIGEHRVDVVFAGDDGVLLTLSRHRERLGAANFPYVAHEHVVRALDKLSLYDAARSGGIAVPETTRKHPGDSRNWIVKERLYWLDTAHDHRLAEKEDPALAGGVVYQRLIVGELHAAVAFVDGDGAVSVVSIQRAQALYPDPFGNSVRAIVVSSDALDEATRAVFAVLPWRGMAELQFVVSPAGVPYLIDFNGRFFGSLALTEAHVHACAAWVEVAMGRRAPLLGRVPAGARYQWLEGDLRRAVESDRRVASIRDAIAWAPGATHSLFAASDPKPAAGLVVDIVHRASRRLRSR